MYNLHRLRMLHELRRLGTVTAVARSLHYTHSSVSEQLRQLEVEVGYPLPEKVGRGLRLTSQGEIVADYAARMLGLADQALAEVAAAAGEIAGTVRLASFPSVLATIAPRALTLLAARHPGLTVHIVHRDVHDALTALHARDVDLVVGERYPESRLPELGRGLDLEVVIDDPMVLLLPEGGPLADEPTDFSGLGDCPWVMDPPDVAAGQWQRDYCRSHGFEPDVLVETPDPFLLLHLVEAGHAVGMLYSLLADPLLGRVRVFPLPGHPHRTLFTAVADSRRNHPALRAVRQALIDAAHDRADPGHQTRKT